MRSNRREVSFDVNAYTARLIGRENVAKLEGAVLEIVKNAYDADAKVFCLYYSNAENCIYIMDNGSGMDEDIVRTHWMTIGNSSKKETFFSKGKRIQTGAKGIGRFALDRISDRCEMLTVSDVGGLEWIVNWSDFSGQKNLSDVKAEIYDTDSSLTDFVNIGHWRNWQIAEMLRNDSSIDFSKTGTVYILKGLHDEWNEEVVDRIRNHLENLLPPNVIDDFRIFFFDDYTDASQAEILGSDVDFFDYKFSFETEGDILHISIKRNEFDFKNEKKEIYQREEISDEEKRWFAGEPKKVDYVIHKQLGQENIIGNFSGVFYFYKISASKKDTARFFYKDVTGRKNLAKEFGGVKLYRDKFRVRPYGEYGDNDFDWLELDARRRRSPAGVGKQNGRWRVGAEQLLGSVYISRLNKNLEDAANRNGIQEGKGFSQLKQIILLVIDEFERDRQSVGRKLADYSDYKNELAAEREKYRRLAEEAARKQFAQSNERAKQSAKRDETTDPALKAQNINKFLNKLEEKNEEEIQELKDENKMLQTLATTGIVTNMFMHEIRMLTNNIGLELDAAYEAITYDHDMDTALENIRSAIAFKKNFASWFGVTIESIKKDKRHRKKYDIKEMLETYTKVWKDILSKSGIKLRLVCNERIMFYCFEFDIENILGNLISNSMASFDREMDSKLEKKEIEIYVAKKENGFIIDYKDSGWGLIEKYREYPERICEPFESSKTVMGEEEGTGMGMWIVNRTALEYNGSIDLEKNKTVKDGFFVTIKLGVA